MRNSRRLKRMGRNRVKITKMNLTSLMDVFTILVFFLLVNSATTEVLEAPKQIKLPDSVIETKPRETVVIFISPEEITVQGERVAGAHDVEGLVDEDREQRQAVEPGADLEVRLSTFHSFCQPVAPNASAASISEVGVEDTPRWVSRIGAGTTKITVAISPGTMPMPKNTMAGIR
mgnify:CR=1 FL=1